jgi:hypothetical protein
MHLISHKETRVSQAGQPEGATTLKENPLWARQSLNSMVT